MRPGPPGGVKRLKAKWVIYREVDQKVHIGDLSGYPQFAGFLMELLNVFLFYS